MGYLESRRPSPADQKDPKKTTAAAASFICVMPGILCDDRLGCAEENLQLLRPLERTLCDQLGRQRRPDAKLVSRREWLLARLEGQTAQLEVIRDLPRRRRDWATEFGDHGAGQFAAVAVPLSPGSAIMLICYRPLAEDYREADAALCLSRDRGGQRYALWHSDTVVVDDPDDAATVAQQLVDGEARAQANERAAIAQRDLKLEQLTAHYRTDGADAPEAEALVGKMRALTTAQERKRLARVLEPAYEDHLAMVAQSAALRGTVNRGIGQSRSHMPPSPALLLR